MPSRYFKRTLPLLAVTFMTSMLLLAGHGFAADSGSKTKRLLVEREAYQAALKASSEGQYEVAAVRFERLLDDKTLTRKERGMLQQRVVDALLRAGQAEKALVLAEKETFPESQFYRAQAMISLRRYSDAELVIKTYLEADGQYAELARMSLAQATAALGRESPARRELHALTESADPWLARQAWLLWNESEIIMDRAENAHKRLESDSSEREVNFLRACAFLKSGDARRAVALLRNLAEADAKSGISKRLRDSAQVRLAEGLNMMPGRQREAEKVLIKFIGKDVPSDSHEAAFALLDSIRPTTSNDALNHYIEWVQHEQVPTRHALALYYLALDHTEKKQSEQAIQLLERFISLYPSHERYNEVLRLLMSLHGVMRNDKRVLELANEWRMRYGTGGEDMVDYLVAMVFFGRHEFSEALKLFDRAARTASEITIRSLAIYNKAVCAAMLGQDNVYQECMAELQKPEAVLPESNSRNMANVPRDQAAHLLLERGLQLAFTRDVAAETTLQDFIARHPDHPRLAEAHLALAEFCLLSVPPRIRTARAALDAAQEIDNLSPKMEEALHYARLWLYEAEGTLPDLVEVGNAYLSSWTESPRRDEVRMKMAQAYYRLEEFSKAEFQFEQVNEDTPNSPYAEVALFFAGKAAMNLPTDGMERALTLWADVVTRNGPLSRLAQRHQAAVKRRQGKEAEALPVIENLLAAKDIPVEEKHSLLLEQGELLELLGREDPKRLDESLGVFIQVLDDPAARRDVRCRAGVLLARSYRQAGRNSEALEAYYKVVEFCMGSMGSEALNPLEYQWFYRAGFAALDLLEERQQWQAAADLADSMAAGGGERSEEARARATRIRLEHFLWEDS